MLFKWKDDFNTGINEIDLQHRKLFKLGSEIYVLATLKDGLDHYDEIIKILDELKDYAVYHFDFEEKYMSSKNFSDLDEHKKLHSAFIDKISSIESKDIDDKQKTVLLQLLDFTANWIGSHILKEDFKYRNL